MSIVHRRTFYGKVGTADKLVAVLQEGYETLHKFGGTDIKVRILSDFMSGRTDRVVTEDEAESFGAIEAAYGTAMSDPEAHAWFKAWEPKLQELIQYAEAANWTVR